MERDIAAELQKLDDLRKRGLITDQEFATQKARLLGSQIYNATYFKKPGKLTAVAGMRLGSGICNILCGLGLFWLIYPLLLIPLGIIEIMSAAKLLKNPPVNTNIGTLAVLEIISIIALNWISMIVGILTLIFVSDANVKEYLATIEPAFQGETVAQAR